jgi:hypothetical protein
VAVEVLFFTSSRKMLRKGQLTPPKLWTSSQDTRQRLRRELNTIEDVKKQRRLGKTYAQKERPPINARPTLKASAYVL